MEIVDCEVEEQDQNVQVLESHVEFGPATHDQHLENLKDRLAHGFCDLQKCRTELIHYVEMFGFERMLVEVRKVEELIVSGKCCDCNGERKIVNRSVVGRVMTLEYKCWNGHSKVWNSSSILGLKRDQKLFVTPLV